jgi:hypothetical protein
VTRRFLAALLFARAAAAQDFSGASPAGSTRAPEGLLDRALPSASATFSASASQTRWWGLPDLETRSASLGGSFRSWRAAIGLSQTGEPELGWTALGLGIGATSDHAGAGLRACVRRDRDAPWSVARAFTTGDGVEAGAGAWVMAGDAVRAWASAPQVWTAGAAPPLARPLELGVRVGDEDAAWVRIVAPRAGDDGERALGLSLWVAPLQAWAEVRDAPLRGSVGLSASIAALRLAVRVDAHPVLGETTRLSLAWVRARRSSP